MANVCGKIVYILMDTFYRGQVMSYNSFASVYDELTFNVDYKKRAEYVQGILKGYGISDGLLLDLACGTGSMAIEFAKMGYEVIATDASADMLMEAQNKAYDNEQSIMFLCQRMEETDLYGTVADASQYPETINVSGAVINFVVKSANNIQGVATTFMGSLNVYDILNHDVMVVTKDAVSKIEEVYA